MSSLSIIVAATRTNGIGQNGQLPFRLPREMAYFARVTKTAPPERPNAVIMGRKTWESIPSRHRPLIGRVNVIITRNQEYDLGPSRDPLPSYVEPSLNAAISRVNDPTIHRPFIIGGSQVYNEAISLERTTPTSPAVDRILLTRILSPAFEECDVFFPEIRDSPDWTRALHEELEEWVGFEVPRGIQEENGVQYEFQMWVRRVRV